MSIPALQYRSNASLWILCRCMSTNDDCHWSRDSLRPAWGSDWACCGFHAVCAALSWWDDFGFARQYKFSKELDVQSYYLLFRLEVLKIPWILVYTEVPSTEIINLWTRILDIHKLNRAEKPTFPSIDLGEILRDTREWTVRTRVQMTRNWCHLWSVWHVVLGYL